MIELDWSQCVIPPWEHQRLGVKVLLGLEKHGRTNLDVLALLDQVGAGKSKQIIDTSQIFYRADRLDTMLVLAPAFAVSVWANADPVMGQVAAHGWRSVDNVVQVYHSDTPTLDLSGPGLKWVVTNYEFLRRKERLASLMKQLHGRRIWFVGDEAWAIKSHKSENFKSCRKIRYEMCDWATILNGTPIANNPLDLYAQMMVLDPRILFPTWQPKTISQGFMMFRNRYAIMGGFQMKEIVGWQNLDELNARVAPYILRRETRECVDLPPVLPPVVLEARLSDSAWKLYVQMRDDLVAWLDENTASTAKQSLVKGLRLAQICSGFLGGIQTLDEQPDLFDPNEVYQIGQVGDQAPVEIDHAKLTVLQEWLEGQDVHKLIVWCRFRAELDRTATVLATKFPRVLRLWGGQTTDERAAATRALAPNGDPDPAIVVGTTGAGGAGLNLAGANIAVYLSNDFSLKTRLQADGRIDRPGQTRPVQYVDIVARGPKGQKTYDDIIRAALHGKEDVANWSAAQWRAKLLEE